MDAEHEDKTYKNNPDVQPGPEPNKSYNEKPSGEMVKVEILAQTAPLLPNLLAPVQMTSQPLSLQIHCMYLYLCSVFFLFCEGYFIWLHLHAHDWPLNLDIHGMHFNGKIRSS